jgi:Uma2 family endonuclease
MITNKKTEYRIQHIPTYLPAWRDPNWQEVKGYFPTLEMAYEKIHANNQSPALQERKYRILKVETTTKVVDMGIPATSSL